MFAKISDAVLHKNRFTISGYWYVRYAAEQAYDSDRQKAGNNCKNKVMTLHK